MPRDAQPLRSEGELFKKVMGAEWQKLHPDIQRRFDKNPAPGKPLRYTGTLDELSCSVWGKMLGFITMPLIKGSAPTLQRKHGFPCRHSSLFEIRLAFVHFFTNTRRIYKYCPGANRSNSRLI